MLSCSIMFNSFVTSWTVSYQAPLSVECPRQEYWSGLPFLTPGDLSNPGFKPEAPMSPALAGGFFAWEAECYIYKPFIYKPKLGKIYIYFSLSKLFILIIFSVLYCLGLSFLHVGISPYTSRILEVLNTGSSFQGQVINWHYSRQIETHSPPNYPFSSVQSLSHVRLFAIPWTAACQASLSITNSWSLPKLMSTESVMPSNQLILCHPLFLPLSIFPSIRVFSNSQFFASGGKSIGVSASASILPMNIQD